MQIQLTQLPSLPPALGNSPDAQKELTLARTCSFECAQLGHLWDNGFAVLVTGDTLELAVFLSVKLQDEAAFERNYQQLQMYVSDTR